MGFEIFVGNLAPEASEQGLRDIFAADDRLVRCVRIVVYPRGFAFVEMVTESDAEEAIAALNGKALHGRNLRVTRANDQPRHNQDSRPPARGFNR
ncbi:MAG: RNA recognition motif domain-containing protein [Planctomycetota bacterium]|jgi:RNA recognition motif-containing protein